MQCPESSADSHQQHVAHSCARCTALSCCHTARPSQLHCPLGLLLSVSLLPAVLRDLKPENFLLTGKAADSELKLTDFGLGEWCPWKHGSAIAA